VAATEAEQVAAMTFEQKLAVLIGAAIALAALVECGIQARRWLWRTVCAAVERHVSLALDGPFATTRRQIAALETTEERP